jgi:MFS family permease
MTGGRDCAILRRAPLGDTKLSEASSPEIAAGGAIYVAEEHGRKTTRALFAILCYQGYAFAILGVGAPFIGKSFALDQSGIARMYAWISLNSIGALVLSRMADLIGRRRILMLSLLVTPLGSLGALLSSSAAWFILFEILVYSANWRDLRERDRDDGGGPADRKKIGRTGMGKISQSRAAEAFARYWRRSSRSSGSRGDGCWEWRQSESYSRRR